MAESRVDTTQVRLYLVREPAKTRGCARLIHTLCDEIDLLRVELRRPVDDELTRRIRALEAERLAPVPTESAGLSTGRPQRKRRKPRHQDPEVRSDGP